jgi:hypothetical protein
MRFITRPSIVQRYSHKIRSAMLAIWTNLISFLHAIPSLHFLRATFKAEEERRKTENNKRHLSWLAKPGSQNKALKSKPSKPPLPHLSAPGRIRRP